MTPYPPRTSTLILPSGIALSWAGSADQGDFVMKMKHFSALLWLLCAIIWVVAIMGEPTTAQWVLACCGCVVLSVTMAVRELKKP